MSDKNSSIKKLMDKAVGGIQVFSEVTRQEAWARTSEVAFVGVDALRKLHERKGPYDPQLIENIATIAVQKGRMDRKWLKSFCLQTGYHDGDGLIHNLLNDEEDSRPNILISYRLDSADDYTLAVSLHEKLQPYCQKVFLESKKETGAEWAERRVSELQVADAIIVILSHEGSKSGVISELLRLHQHLSADGDTNTLILPVGNQYTGPLPASLQPYLLGLPWVINDPQNAQDIVGPALIAAIMERSPLPHIPADYLSNSSFLHNLSTPDPAGDGTYIERFADQHLLNMLDNKNLIMTIMGPREIGKQLFVSRLIDKLSAKGHEIVHLDMRLFESAATSQAATAEDQFLNAFLNVIGLEVDYDFQSHIDRLTMRSLTGALLATEVFEKFLKSECLNNPLVLCLENADVLINASFRDSFFSMLRTWHDRCKPSTPWANFSLVMSISTQPLMLIKDPRRSPFNVGERITLTDFTLEETGDLNDRYLNSLNGLELEQLFELTGGHPFLTHEAIKQVAMNQIAFPLFLETASTYHGPFGDHLRSLFLRLENGGEELIQGMRNVLTTLSCAPNSICERLIAAGLVRRSGHDKVVPRNKIYGDFFNNYFN